MGLAAMSLGVGLLIERAGEAHLGTGASVALLGGVMLYLVSLVARRSVTVGGPRRLGVSLKLGAVAIILGLLLARAALPPLALAGGRVGVLAALVFGDRALYPPLRSTA